MSTAEILAIFALLITVVGSSFAILAYFKPRKRQRLLYKTYRIQYFGEQKLALPSDFVMIFQGENVKRLAKTILILWNGGTDVLIGEDITTDNRIRIHLPEGNKILSNKLVGESDKSNNLRIEELLDMPNEFAINYKYLNTDDGAVIEVMHDSEDNDLTIIGAAKGLSGGPKKMGNVNIHDINQLEEKSLRRVTMIIMVFTGLMFIAMSGFGWVNKLQYMMVRFSELFYLNFWNYFLGATIVGGSAILGLVCIIISIYVFWKRRRGYPKSLRRFL